MQTQLDWLGEELAPARIVPEENYDWIEAESIEAKKSGVPYDSLRFACMRGSGRVWACDGEYAAFRPYNHVLDKKVNPEFQERMQKFREAGHCKHVGTFDEVEVYQLLEGNPWKATVTEKYVAGRNLWADIRHAAKLACAREWRDYTDLLEAMATGMRAGRDPEFARKAWQDAVEQIMINIYQQRGPTPAEVRAGVQNVRQARGYGPSAPGIVMVSDITNTKNVVFEK